jgi:hypothetical protein
MTMLGLAWAANWYAVKAWAPRRMRLTRGHKRGPDEGLFGQLHHGRARCRSSPAFVRCYSFGLFVGAVPSRVAGVSVVGGAAADEDVAAYREVLVHCVAWRATAGAGASPARSHGAESVEDGSTIPGR